MEKATSKQSVQSGEKYQEGMENLIDSYTKWSMHSCHACGLHTLYRNVFQDPYGLQLSASATEIWSSNLTSSLGIVTALLCPWLIENNWEQQ